MKSSLALVAVAIAVAAASSASQLAAAPASSSLVAAPLAGPPAAVMFGHVKSLTRKGGGYEMRFDPALWLQGVTANRAAVEDKVIKPGETVPNDYYIREEGRRLLTYLVPAGTRVTVLTTSVRSIRIPVSELAQILQGKNPRNRRLMDPGARQLGFWIRVPGDTVRSLDQQYQP